MKDHVVRFTGPWVVLQDGGGIESHPNREEAEKAQHIYRDHAARISMSGIFAVRFDEGWELKYGHFNKVH